MRIANIDPVVMAEAERWFARLGRDSVSSDDHQAFESWRARPEHAAAYAEIERIWGQFGRLQGHPGLDHLMARVGKLERPRWSRLEWALAASVTICLLVGAAFTAGYHYVAGKPYATEFGQRSIVQLEDGSQVVLNSATRLKVRFAAGRRDITLKQGEALFTVAHDPTRPFAVTAGDGTVTALGTRFQVRSERNGVIVTLLDGKVSVDREDTRQHLQLKPGDQLKFMEDESSMQWRRVNPEAVSSWISGRLQFEDTPLAEMLAEVNRYSKLQLRLADPSLATIPINGTFDIGNSASVVAALEALLPVEIATHTADQIVITRRPQ